MKTIIDAIENFMKPFQTDPEPSVNPPEVSDEQYERNLRNSARRDIIEAIRTIEDRLEELDRKKFQALFLLTRLRKEIEAEMED